MLRNLSELLPSGNRALGTPFVGLLAADIGAAAGVGDLGPGVFANDSMVAGKRYRALITARTFPAGALVLRDSGGGEFTQSGTATVQVLEDNLLVGSAQLSGQFPILLSAAPCSVGSSSPGALMAFGSAVVLSAATCLIASSSVGGAIAIQPPVGPELWVAARPRVWSVAAVSQPSRVQSFDVKAPDEAVWLVFDFEALAGVVSAPSVAVSRFQGAADLTPGSMLSGAPEVFSGNKVRQRVTGGVAGADYTAACTVDGPNATRLVLAGRLPVRAP